MSAQRFVASAVAQVPWSGIRKFFDIASEMDDVISLGVGEPDFVTPWSVREAAVVSMERGMTHYTSNRGDPALCREISAYMQGRFGLEYDPAAEVLVTVGASEALDLAFRAVIEPGDEVLIPAPSYVSYEPGVSFAGGVPVPVVTRAAQDFIVTPEELEAVISPKTKALVLPYPNNPTGAVMTKKQLEALIPLILRHDLFVISDEIYSELTYGASHASICAFPEIRERSVHINGFSKAFAMTGFRLGWASAPREFLDSMVKIHQYTMLCAPTVSQMAGLEALKEGRQTDYRQVDTMRRSYDRRRRFMMRALADIGLPAFEPRGAFYIFPSVAAAGMRADEFCTRLIREKRVACVPGTAFGEAGEGFVRCSYASSMENLREAVARMGEFMAEHAG